MKTCSAQCVKTRTRYGRIPSRKSLWRILLLMWMLSLLACAQAPRPQVSAPVFAQIPEYPLLAPNGSIFQARRSVMPLFEDRRPRNVGDILTIVVNEDVSASKNSQSSASRSSSSSLTLEQLPDALNALAEYGFDLSAESEFSGAGGARANNTFTGTITVMVHDVMRNGNLIVRGEKQIAINQGTEYIRFSGVVAPRSISGRNTVPSAEVAAARIEYLGDGYSNAAQRMGWLQRFFLSVSPL